MKARHFVNQEVVRNALHNNSMQRTALRAAAEPER